MNNLGQIKSSIEAMGHNVEIQQMCGLTWTDPDNPEIHFTDGNIAVGELTAHLEDGIVVPIPVCQRCLDLVSVDFPVSLAKE